MLWKEAKSKVLPNSAKLDVMERNKVKGYNSAKLDVMERSKVKGYTQLC